MGGVIALVVLDETALGVALPTIRGDLGISILESHWIVNAYLLTLTGLAAVAGKSLDLVGMKRLFLCGLALFGAASLSCGFATSGAMLIAARAVQGVGAAIIFPTSVVMITQVFPPGQRGTAFGIQVTVAALFLASGPLIGGLITQHLDWRWVFWVNFPLVLAVFAIGLACWRDPPRTERPPKLDAWGATAFVVGLGGVVVALMQAVDWGWTSPAILGTLGGSVLILLGFVRHELRTTAPLIQMRLFANRVFTVSNAIVFSAQFSKISVTVLGAMLLQQTVGLSPTEAATTTARDRHSCISRSPSARRPCSIA